MVTLKDIATKCNVSVATVSRALNGQSASTGATTKRILQTAREMGYFPNAAARALKTNRSYNIGILYEDEIHHEYFSLMIDKIKMAAESKGYDITFLCKSKTTSYYEHARYRGLDGVVLLQADFSSPEVLQLAKGDLPCVAINHTYDFCSCVLSDNQDSVITLVRHAAECGHRKIAFVHGQLKGYATLERLKGFRKACRELLLEVPDTYLVPAAYHDPQAAANATRMLMSLDDKPTCILYPDDYSCLGAIIELEKMGLSIPGDIAIIGYDGIMLSSVLRPKLTTYRQNVIEMGLAAVNLLTDIIENGKNSSIRHVMIPGTLQQGGTV